MSGQPPRNAGGLAPAAAHPLQSMVQTAQPPQRAYPPQPQQRPLEQPRQQQRQRQQQQQHYQQQSPEQQQQQRPPVRQVPLQQQQQQQQQSTKTLVDLQPTLRVMRLYKSRLHTDQPPPYPAQVDLLSAGLGDSDTALGKLAMGRVLSDNALTGELILPDSFGSIYRGETFCAYVSVLNHLNLTLCDVKVSAKLLTPMSKKNIPLVDCRLERGATRRGKSSSPFLPQVR